LVDNPLFLGRFLSGATTPMPLAKQTQGSGGIGNVAENQNRDRKSK
jgi:hypothetical protein